jgi:hypothetical protein
MHLPAALGIEPGNGPGFPVSCARTLRRVVVHQVTFWSHGPGRVRVAGACFPVTASSTRRTVASGERAGLGPEGTVVRRILADLNER